MRYIKNEFFSCMMIALCILLSACGHAVQAEDVAASAVEYVHLHVEKVVKFDVLENKSVLYQAQTALQDMPEFSGSQIRVFEKIAFFNGTRPRIELAVQNPKLPEKLLLCTFENGKWTIWDEQDVGYMPQLDRHLFDLNSVDFSEAANYAILWRKYAQQVQAVIDEPYHVAFIYLPKQGKRFWHTAILEAVGAQYYLSFHEDGRVWEFKRLRSQVNDE